MYTIISSKIPKINVVSCNVNINITSPDTEPTYPTDFTNFDMDESMNP